MAHVTGKTKIMKTSAGWQGLSCLMFLLMPVFALADCYLADPAHSDIRFEFAIERSTFTGHFNDFEVSYCWENDAPESGLIDVRINMTSVTTGNSDLDIGMQEPDALNTEQYPVAHWQTRAIIKQGERFRATGTLTIRDISRKESGYFKLEPVAADWRLSGTSELKRLHYDIGIGEYADTEFVPDPVTVEFEFLLKPADQTL